MITFYPGQLPAEYIANLNLLAAAIDATASPTFGGLTITGNTVLGDAEATDRLTVKGASTILANSANSALKVTQTGSGNAFVVEDAASDTTPFIISGSGQVVIGHTSQTGYVPGVAPNFGVLGTDNASASTVVSRYSADTAGPYILYTKSRGAIGAQGLVSNGDSAGALIWAASDGTNPIPLARMDVTVDGTPGTNDMPGRLVFSTTPDGSATPVERYRISSSGSHFFSGQYAVFAFDAGFQFAGFSLRHNGDSSAATKTSYIDLQNNLGVADSHLFASHNTDGSSDIILATTPAGSRSVDRRATRFSILGDGTIALGAAPGAESLRVVPVASGVNRINVSGSASGVGSPYLEATGSDANSTVSYYAKGSGVHAFSTGGAVQFRIASITSALNFWNFYGNTTGNEIGANAAGADANIQTSVSSKGTSGIRLVTGGGEQFRVANIASAVNYAQVTGNATGLFPSASSAGADSSVGFVHSTKGAGEHQFYTGNSLQFKVTNTNSAANWFNMTGSVTGNTTYCFNAGSDTNIGMSFEAKGAGTINFQGSGANQFRVSPTTSAVNYSTITGAVAGGSFGLYAQGSDANTGSAISTKGSSAIGFYTGVFSNLQFTVWSASSTVNYSQVVGASTGNGPSFSAQGSDSTVNLGITSKGTSPSSVFIGTTGGWGLQVTAPSSTVNYGYITGNTTGQPVQFSAVGTDANIDLKFAPKGTGVVVFGTWTSNADAAVNGYVTIKDAGGNIRKLATIA